NLNFNYLYDSVPSTLFNMASLTGIRLSANYLTGTLPAVPAKLTYLAVNHNFLAGAFPSQNFQFCDIRNNCFSNLGTCYNAYGVAQRTSGCNICGTGNAAPPLCGGTVCILNATDALAAGTVNGLGSSPPPMFCAPVTIDPTAGALTCPHIASAAGAEGGAGSVAEHVAGGLAVRRGGQPPHGHQLGGRWLNMELNLLEARLSEWASPLSTLKSLRHLALNYNWFSGPVPSYLLTLSSLTTLNLQFNYLTGTLTGAPAASIKTLNFGYNFLAGTFPAGSTTLCNARSNCFTDASKCLSAGTSAQRAATACAICGAANASTVLCGGGVCAPNTATQLATKTPNGPSLLVLPQVCTGVRVNPTACASLCLLPPPPPSPSSLCLFPLLLSSALSTLCSPLPAPLLRPAPCFPPLREPLPAVPILANMKTALGVPHQEWGVQTLCTVTNNLKGPDDMWGVYCNAQGTVVDFYLKQRFMRGIMHPDISKFTALTALSVPLVHSHIVSPPTAHSRCSNSRPDLSSNFLSGPLDPFISPLTGLTALKYLYALHASPCPLSHLSLFPATLVLRCSPCPFLTCLCSSLTCYSPHSPPSLMCAVVQRDELQLLLGLHPLHHLSHQEPLHAVSALTLLHTLPVPISALSSLHLLPCCTVCHVIAPTFPPPRPPCACVCARGERRSLGWNYLTGTVPVPGTALQVLDLENNWLNGKFPSTANWYFCTARANCFNDPTPCKNNNNQGITQRPSCAICNSADATGTLCGGLVVCQPDPAAVKAVTAVPTTSTPVLALTCPPVPPVTTDATAGMTAAAATVLLLAHASHLSSCACPMPLNHSDVPHRPPPPASALMNIKTALGVTYTSWAPSATCNAVGSSGGGGFTGVECNSVGQPVKIFPILLPASLTSPSLSPLAPTHLPAPPRTPPPPRHSALDSQKLFGILHADITKLTALTFLSLKSNLFRARLEEFARPIPSLPNLAVLLLDFNWFFGSLPPAMIGMPKLTRLGLSYNYLTYRVPPVSAALKDLDVSFNFLSGSFPANTATSCGAANNCFKAITGCTTTGTAQRSTGCSFCESTTAQGMLCYGRGVCTVDAAAPFNAGTPNAVGAATLPLACVNMSAATPFLPALPWHSQRPTHPLRRAPLPSPNHRFPSPPRRPVVVARALETPVVAQSAAAAAPAAATLSACGVEPRSLQPLAAANDATLSLLALLAGPASAALLLLLVAHGFALPPVAAVASAAGMPAGVAEPAAVEEVGGMRTCSAGYGEGQARGWCAQTSAEDANGAASAGLTSGERFGLPETLRNRYVLLRHGRSLANERGLIVSSLANGVAAEFGLAAEGRQQAQRAGRQLSELLEQRGVAARDVVLFASPFSRTQQTAALAAKELGINVLGTRFQTAEELRERYFGRHLELNSHDLYPAVWVDDRKDTAFRPGGDGESVVAMAQRTARLIRHIEEDLDEKVVVLLGTTAMVRAAALLLVLPALAILSVVDPEVAKPAWDDGVVDGVDADLFRRAMVQIDDARLAEPRGKIAFLFLVRGPLPLQEIWHRFF
ncbi:unnamed protein product, partial [Closterium sp. Naga37s-1]